MKLERLISMIYMLLNHEVISASALAEKYQVSQRTIYRDIDVICAAGIPVVSYQGMNGGFGIMETYKMDKSLLGSYDVGTLITILHSLSTVFDDEQAMDTARKLQTIQKDEQAPRLSMDIGSSFTDRESLRLLREAIMARRVVAFTYISGKNERTNRTVEPVSLKYRYHSWYLYGFCQERSDYREFRLSRMAELTVLQDVFQRQHELPARNDSGYERPQTELVDVVLHFMKDSLARAMDYFSHGEKQFHPDGSMTITLKLGLTDSSWLIPILLSFGDGVEISQPEAYRQQVKETLERMLQRYD